MSSVALATLGGPGAFANDPRFAAPVPGAAPIGPDPVERAWAEGHAAGLAEARAEAAAAAEAEAGARQQIELSLLRLDADLAEALRQKLHVTVEALCEAAIAPLALDKAALADRVARAAAMLARADDDKRLRLHPDDLKLVQRQLPKDLPTEPDPSLPRGSLRIECASGGVEDGPEHWRRAIAEALSQC